MPPDNPNIIKILEDKKAKILIIDGYDTEDALNHICLLQKYLRRQSSYYTKKCYYGEYKTKKGEERARKMYRMIGSLINQLSSVKEQIVCSLDEELREEGKNYDERMKEMKKLSKYFG